jgi:LDH2 family malate/lactate/ureidoglycolate dehydrogenase
MNAVIGEQGVKADRLAAVTSAILASTGVPEADARLVADSLVDADLRGIHSHGVSRLGIYIERLRMGGNRPSGEPELLSDAPSLALLDANDLLAHVASARAVQLATQKAKLTGCATVCVRGASHFGAAGYWARLIAEQGMLGMASTNTTPVMAAWGGSTTAIGSNPLAMAFPSSGDAPVVVDMATSETTWGALLRAEATGTPIPDSWALGPDGSPTTSAVEAVAAGRLLPFGRHKGYALAVGVELLTGALAGANCLSQIAHLYMEPEKPMGAGLFFLAVDPMAVPGDDGGSFAQKVHEVQRSLNALPPRDPGGRVLWPGQLEAERAARARKEGVPLEPMVIGQLRGLARQLSVPEDLLVARGEGGAAAVHQSRGSSDS